MTLQVGPVIGKVGGADVVVTPVSASGSGTGDKTLTTVTVPDGEVRCVYLDAAVTVSGVGSSGWTYTIGTVEVSGSGDGHVGPAGVVVVGPASVAVKYRSSYYEKTIATEGAVYSLLCPVEETV